MFVRFVVGSDGEHHRDLTGIIIEARLLREDGLLSAEEAAQLERSYDWLNDHLPVPPFSTRWPRDAVAWFKDDAQDAIARMWDLVALLKEHGRAVRLLRSKNPGRVLYEDDFQVVVEEWKHSDARSPLCRYPASRPALGTGQARRTDLAITRSAWRPVSRSGTLGA